MSSSRLVFYNVIVFLLILQVFNTQGQTYSLSGSAPYGIRGEDYRFSCQISGGNIPQGVQFNKDSATVCKVLSSACQLSSSDTRYTCGCINGNNRQLYLNITNVQSTDAGTWTCRDSFNIGTSSPVTLRVYYGPENIRFTPTKSSIIVIENESRTVSCSADCNPPPCNISWYKDSTIISSTELLPLNNIQSQQAGNYTCQVTNTQIPGSLQSKQLKVIVHYLSTITSLTSNASNNMEDEGSTVTFTCSVDSLPSLVISWSRSQQGEQLYSGSQYTIPEASCQHTDNYTCTASNNIGQSVSKTIPLYVRCSPRENIETKRNITNRINTKINLAVDIIAYPRPIFIWYHTPTRQIINTAITQQLSTINYKSAVDITLNSTLFGDYTISVTNGIGAKIFTITVIDGEPQEPVGSNNIPTIVGSIFGVLICIAIIVVIVAVLYRTKAPAADDNTYDGLGGIPLSNNQPVYDEINSSATRSSTYEGLDVDTYQQLNTSPTTNL